MRNMALVLLLSLPCSAQLTFTNMVGARTINTIYHNTSIRPLLVLMTPSNSPVGGVPATTDAQLLIDSVTPPVQQVARNTIQQNFGSAGNETLVFGIVPAGYYYEVVFSGNNTPFSVPYASETSLDTATGGVQSTPARSLTTIYHNTTSGVIWVEITVLCGISAGTVTFLSDASATPTTTIAIGQNDSGKYMQLMAPVLPGNFYQVTGSTVTLDSWVETTTPGLTLTQTDVTASRCEDGVNYVTCNYIAQTPLFSAVTSTPSGFKSAGSHFGGNGLNISSLADVESITRNGTQKTEVFIPVPFGWSYGDRNDNSGSTLSNWIEYYVPAMSCLAANCGEKRRRVIN